MATLKEAQSSKGPNPEQLSEMAKADVQGALIFNDHPSSPTKLDADGAQHDPSIRLPNHKGLVSHVALDVSVSLVRRQVLTSHRSAVR